MRTRLCYLALVLVPLAAYWPVLLHEFGTPEDFVRLALGGSAPDSAHQGILHGALVEISFLAVNGVAQFAFVRGLALLLIILSAIALWQMLERGGWSEFDAAIVALAVSLLPAPQLLAGWGAAWPAALAGLLSLAGFAAAESELERGGPRRFIAMLGGVLLYFAAAMCNLASSLLALVPLAALCFVRPFRLWAETKKWFALHTALMLGGVLGAWALERWMMADVGLTDRTTLAARAMDLAIHALPSAGALFLVGVESATRIIGMAVAGAGLVAIVAVARRQVASEARALPVWWLGALGPLAIFCFVVLLLPHWRAGDLNYWAASGIVVVCLVAMVRGVGEQTAKRLWWHRASLVGLVAVGVLAAGAQVYSHLAAPLAEEWSSLRTAVLRANFGATTQVQLRLPDDAVRMESVPEAAFDARVARHALAAQHMFNAALRSRFSSGLPKGHRVEVSTAAPRDDAAPADLVFDLRATK